MTKKKNNKIDEQTFLKVLDNISKRLAYKFKFGYHSFEDMKQQAAIFALEGLERYDNSRPLENFLWTHVRNRLFNYKRDNYQRPDKPCLKCRFYDPKCSKSTNQCSEYKNKDNCEEYSSWNNRNSNKKNIMKPSSIEDSAELASSGSLIDLIDDKQIIDILDKEIESEFRETYLKLKHGEKVYKSDLNKLIKHIRSILFLHNYHV